MNNKIDVIIPAYNVKDENLYRCLASVACQSIVKDIQVTIVDDGSEKENYVKVIEAFKEQLDVQIIKNPVNGGCGVARQYGIDHTSNSYFTFLDTDDTFNGAFALEALRIGIESDNLNYSICVGCFDEIQISQEYGAMIIPHNENMVWMHGKLYRRSYIENNNIRFHKTSRANEDGGFNTIIKLMEDKDNPIKFIPARVYYWHENNNSITRAGNRSYAYGSSKRDSFFGYVENQIYAIKEVYQKQPNNQQLLPYAVTVMINLYGYYLEVCDRAPENAEANFKWCKWYYDEIYKHLQIPEALLKRTYFEIMRGKYLSPSFVDIIPEITFKDFIKKLQKN